MKMHLDLNSIASYRQFLAIKSLPTYRFIGREAHVPDEYAKLLGVKKAEKKTAEFIAPIWMYDYQAAITALAIRKKKFACFIECGLGKCNIMLAFAQHCSRVLPRSKRTLIIAPLMVIKQTLEEMGRFFPGMEIEQVAAADLPAWTKGKGGIGIVNYEALKEYVPRGNIGALLCDESSLLRSHYGKWGQQIIRLGKGIEWKLALTGTPAPNDRIEYANHAVFLDAFPNVNSFLAKFFVNRGQTGERWELKPHALKPFYRALSHWCIFLTNPATYGWKDNSETIPPIHVHIEDVPMTEEQQAAVFQVGGNLYGQPGGITSRSKLSQISKGHWQGKRYETNKPEFIRRLVDSWPEEFTIIWCLYNEEQKSLERVFPDAVSLKGETPYEERQRGIDDFKAGRKRVVISKSKVLGFGLNLQVASRQVFSGLVDSWEMFHQCVKRSNRIGSSRDLNVHIPVTEAERPMVDTVLHKAHRIDLDNGEQERIFKEYGYAGQR